MSNQKEYPMVTAIVLINVDHGHVNDVADQLIAMPGVAEVYSVGGRFDLVAIIRVKTNDDMADLVTNHMLALNNIKDTETLLAFKAFSEFDLERMFSIGMEE
jgi:DNA-binding Lrp family transcriptional regulator